MKKYLILLLSFGFALSCFSQKTKKNDKNEDKNKFEGRITYIGKVTRIPDKKKTTAKLGDVDSYFDLVINENFFRKEENIQNRLQINTTEGIKNEIFFQTIRPIPGDTIIFIEATPQEQHHYGLTARNSDACSSKKVSAKTSKRKKIVRQKCTKVICNMVTTDNIRVQLVAWVAASIKVNGFYTPYFGELSGFPLMYDYYNGEYVVTYTATKIKKGTVLDSYFSRPNTQSITMTEYLNNN
jgi:hypothetical protein